MLPELTIAQGVLLATLGVGIGALGAAVGVGGGFLLVPALLFIFPDADPAVITSISLTAVLLNAASATAGYRRRRLQDIRTAGILAAAAVPAAIGGALLTRVTDRGLFDLVFGVALLGGSVYLGWRGMRLSTALLPSKAGTERTIVDRAGTTYIYRVRQRLASGIAIFSGFIAAFFGIGGGIINVPIMVLVLRMPPTVSVATSQLALMTASAAAVAVHLAFSFGESGQWIRALIAGGGTIVGAQVGVLLGSRVSGRVVLTLISLGLLVAGVRQLVAGLG